MSQIELDDLPLFPRDSGAEWPSTRSWTDSERLELRELQLQQVLQQNLDEARLWAREFRRIAEAIWSDDYDSDDIDKVFDKWLALPEWFKDQSEQR